MKAEDVLNIKRLQGQEITVTMRSGQVHSGILAQGEGTWISLADPEVHINLKDISTMQVV